MHALVTIRPAAVSHATTSGLDGDHQLHSASWLNTAAMSEANSASCRTSLKVPAAFLSCVLCCRCVVMSRCMKMTCQHLMRELCGWWGSSAGRSPQPEPMYRHGGLLTQQPCVTRRGVGYRVSCLGQFVAVCVAGGGAALVKAECLNPVM
jgi:hypothetical protein